MFGLVRMLVYGSMSGALSNTIYVYSDKSRYKESPSRRRCAENSVLYEAVHLGSYTLAMLRANAKVMRDASTIDLHVRPPDIVRQRKGGLSRMIRNDLVSRQVVDPIVILAPEEVQLGSIYRTSSGRMVSVPDFWRPFVCCHLQNLVPGHVSVAWLAWRLGLLWNIHTYRAWKTPILLCRNEVVVLAAVHGIFVMRLTSFCTMKAGRILRM